MGHSEFSNSTKESTTRPNCALDRRTFLCLCVSGFVGTIKENERTNERA